MRARFRDQQRYRRRREATSRETVKKRHVAPERSNQPPGCHPQTPGRVRCAGDERSNNPYDPSSTPLWKPEEPDADAPSADAPSATAEPDA